MWEEEEDWGAEPNSYTRQPAPSSNSYRGTTGKYEGRGGWGTERRGYNKQPIRNTNNYRRNIGNYEEGGDWGAEPSGFGGQPVRNNNSYRQNTGNYQEAQGWGAEPRGFGGRNTNNYRRNTGNYEEGEDWGAEPSGFGGQPVNKNSSYRRTNQQYQEEEDWGTESSSPSRQPIQNQRYQRQTDNYKTDEDWLVEPSGYNNQQQRPNYSNQRTGSSSYTSQQNGNDSVNVPPKDVGLIIGRGGSRIRELQEEFGVSIQLDRQSGEVVIEGGSDWSRRDCIEKIENLLNRNNLSNDSRSFGHGGMGSNRGYDIPREESGGIFLEIPIQETDIGVIIGRGGSKIQEIQRESGSKVKVDRDALVVNIWGSEECCQKAEKLIKEATSSVGYRSNQNYRNNNSNWNQNSRNYHDEDDEGEVQPFQGEWLENQPEPSHKPELIDWAACLKQSEEISNKRWAHLPPVIKDFYQEDPEVAAMMAEEVEEFRKNSNNIMVSNLDEGSEDRLCNPVTAFEQAFGAYPDIMREIEKNKFVTPSPVQSQAWPLLLSGRDTIAIAQTGTGKTLAFLLPAFIHIEGQVTPREERNGPSVICLCPTRELAQQIYSEVLKYHYHNIKAVCIYGGKGRKEQIQECQKGVEIVIATPGRLNDLISCGVIALESVTYLILDEADRMLDMGFEPDIRKILLDIRPDRQSVMTSATWPYGVRKMASRYLKNAAQIFVGSLDLNAVHTVRQELRFIADEDKRAALFHIITNELSPDDKILVFCGRKSTCSDVASDLSRNDIPCESIHGDRDQEDREIALADFKSSEIRILIATDVASRGLDVTDITHVLNYDFPKDMEEYVHRVGRTGRAGRSGVAISFMTRQDWNKAKELIKILQDAEQEVPEELEKMSIRFEAHQEKIQAERSFADSLSGGRRFGGGGGGGGGGCFNCGNEGHMARDCPEPRQGGRGGGRGGRGGRRF